MSFEIEAKLKVDSHELVSQRLKEANAQFVVEQVHIDYYFRKTANPEDRPLRIRKLKTSHDSKVFLTYKGPKEKSLYKRREEIEIEVSDFDNAKKILEAIGYYQALAFEKNRQVWHLKGCEVVLDTLPLLGKFIEIEGPDENVIKEVQNDIGAGDLEHIKNGYVSLMSKKIAETGIEERTFFLQKDQK